MHRLYAPEQPVMERQKRGNDHAGTMRYPCHGMDTDGIIPCENEVIVEEPLSINVSGKPVTTLMCTPGDEIALTIGYLFTEGIVRSMDEIGAIGYCREASGNVVQVTPSGGADLLSRTDGFRTVFSSCSICGRESIRSITSTLSPFVRPNGRLSPEAIYGLADCMVSGQRYFRSTGGSHAVALAPVEGTTVAAASVVVKEDIGRHNALDKAVGEAKSRKMPLERSLLFLSGRVSFEMVAKAARAGISDVAAVSAPTNLAVELAREMGMFLAGFVRGRSAVVFAGKEALIGT